MTATATVAPSLRLVPPATEPARLGTLELLRWSVEQMERDEVSRRTRRRFRGARVRYVREVLDDVQNVVALCGLCLPRQHPTQQLVSLICDAIDHELGRDPTKDYTPQFQRRLARVAAAMAAEARGAV